MKRKRLLFLIILPFMMFSCNDDNGGFTRIKDIEHRIYISIKEYREDNGHNGPFVEQYLMVEEAQLYSYKMANGMVPVGLEGVDEHWNTLNEKFGFYNQNALVLTTASSNEDQILSELLQISGADTILQGDLTQCGVGVEVDTTGLNYVTVLLAKADS